MLVPTGFHLNPENNRLYVTGQWRVRCRCGHIMPTRWGFRDVRMSIVITEPKKLRYPLAPRALIHRVIHKERSHR